MGQPERPAKCSDTSDTSETVIYRGAYPVGYYKFASWFVSGDAEASVLRIRAANSLLATVLISGALAVSRRRLRSAFVASLLLGLGPLHLSLIASTHQQSWSIAAVMTGWVFAHVVFDNRIGPVRLFAGGLWLVGMAMAVSSRWEGGPYYAALSALAVIPRVATWHLDPRRKRVVALAIAGLLLATQIPNWTFSARRWFGGVNTTPLNPSGPDVWTWFSSWLIHFPSVAMEIFGGGGMATDDVRIPSLGPTFGPLLLGGVCAFALARVSRIQIASAMAQVVVIFLSILYFTNIELDLLTLPGRYITPLVGPLVGLLIFQSPSTPQFLDVVPLKRMFFVSFGVFHAIALHSFVERFVVGTRESISLMSINTESWWWERALIGPNAAVALGSGYFSVLLVATWYITQSPESSDPSERAAADA
jgi:hypothetical protein